MTTPMTTNLEFAQSIMKGVAALDRPLGQIMEIVRGMDDAPDKAALKECCGVLLHLQFELMERIAMEYPELGEDSGTRIG